MSSARFTGGGHVRLSGILLLAAGLLSLLLGACGGSDDEAFKVGAKAPDFSLPAVGGQEAAVADYDGKQAVPLVFHMAY